MKKILTILVSIILAIVVGFGFMFRKEISTMLSIKKIDDYGFYSIDVQSDYYLDELVAAGGAETDGELVSFLVSNIMRGLPIEFNIPDFGCSTFQVQNKEGDWLFGRNYDLNPIPSMLVKTQPEDGYRSIAIANANVIGLEVNQEKLSLMQRVMSLASPYVMMDGLNEKGLSIGVLLIKDEATNQMTSKPDLTTTSMMRLVLDKAQNVQEAIEIFEAFDMHASSGASYHFQITDAAGDSVIIEYIDNEISVIEKESDAYQYLTNFLVSEAKYGFGKGHDRYEVIKETLNDKNGVLSETEAMDLLKEVSQDDPAGGTTQTQWSVVYNNTDLTLDVVINNNFDTVYSYTFEELFK